MGKRTIMTRAAAGSERILARALGQHTGAAVLLRGWVHRQRDLGGVCFVLLRDRSGICQVVFDSAPADAAGSPVTLESVVEVGGVVAANGKAPGGYEVKAQRLEIISAAAADLPLAVNQDPSQLSLDAMLEHRMVSLRNPKTLAIFRLQAAIVQHFADHLRSAGFTEIKSSKLIGSGTEGGTGLFAVGVLRPHGVLGAVAAALQAGDGGGRAGAGVRDRHGVPGGEARYAAPHQ